MDTVFPKVGHGSGKEVSKDQCLDPLAPIRKSRGRFLPHWSQEGKLQFVTFRLADSLPLPAREQLEEYGNLISKENFRVTIDDLEGYLNKIDDWLDQEYGECILRYEEIQLLVNDSFLFYDKKKYDLYDYVIMPNHVHLLMIPYYDLENIINEIKRFTTTRINHILGRTGVIWQRDFYDRIIRNLSDYSQTAEYIRNNPFGKT